MGNILKSEVAARTPLQGKPRNHAKARQNGSPVQ